MLLEDDTSYLKLRTLALKSILGFGYYANYSVQQLLDRGMIKVILHSYYGLSKISYLPEILDAVFVAEEDRISKPGKIEDHNKREAFIQKAREKYWASLSEIEQFKRRSNIKYMKRKRARDGFQENHSATKHTIHKINHGHRKSKTSRY